MFSSSTLLPDSEPLPPPPPPPLLKVLTAQASAVANFSDTVSSMSSPSYSPSVIIITAILALVVLASASIHLLLRLFSHHYRSSPPLVHPRPSSSSSSSSSSAPGSEPESPPPSDLEKEHEKEREALIAALPTFTLAAAVAAAPRSSADCAVCLSRFCPHDALRLLPACRHAFHATCVDAWLRSSPSCPLCRSPVTTPLPPPPPAAAQRELQAEEGTGSFRVEIGSVSRRRSNGGDAPPQNGRTYSLGSAFEYLVEEEIEAVVARALRPTSTKEQKPYAVVDSGGGGGERPLPPGTEVAEVVGERSGSWLRDYVDRLASSASSSFSSLRFSSRRFDGGASDLGGGYGWDLEANDYRAAEETAAAAAGEGGGYSAFYRWLLGVSS